MSLREPRVAAVLEPIPVQDVFLTGIEVEDCGDHVRVVGFSDRQIHGGTERTIVLRYVLTKINFIAAVGVAMGSVGAKPH